MTCRPEQKHTCCTGSDRIVPVLTSAGSNGCCLLWFGLRRSVWPDMACWGSSRGSILLLAGSNRGQLQIRVIMDCVSEWHGTRLHAAIFALLSGRLCRTPALPHSKEMRVKSKKKIPISQLRQQQRSGASRCAAQRIYLPLNVPMPALVFLCLFFLQVILSAWRR